MLVVPDMVDVWRPVSAEESVKGEMFAVALGEVLKGTEKCVKVVACVGVVVGGDDEFVAVD